MLLIAYLELGLWAFLLSFFKYVSRLLTFLSLLFIIWFFFWGGGRVSAMIQNPAPLMRISPRHISA